jgi:hypothetical protein
VVTVVVVRSAPRGSDVASLNDCMPMWLCNGWTQCGRWATIQTLPKLHRRCVRQASQGTIRGRVARVGSFEQLRASKLLSTAAFRSSSGG